MHGCVHIESISLAKFRDYRTKIDRQFHIPQPRIDAHINYKIYSTQTVSSQWLKDIMARGYIWLTQYCCTIDDRAFSYHWYLLGYLQWLYQILIIIIGCNLVSIFYYFTHITSTFYLDVSRVHVIDNTLMNMMNEVWYHTSRELMVMSQRESSVYHHCPRLI